MESTIPEKAAKLDHNPHPLDRYRNRYTWIGALVFGYYFGFILTRFYIQDEFRSIKREIISSGVLGAAFGSVIGGWMNDRWGRRYAVLVADLFISGGGVLLILLLSITSSWVTVGKAFIGFGIGIASVTSPIYILEASSTHLREHLLDCNYMLFAFGKFFFFCADTIVTSYSEELNTSDYIIAMVGLPALVQFVLMRPLPESPIWLYKKNQKEYAYKAMRQIYISCEVDKEFAAMELSVKNEIAGQDEKSYSSRNILSMIRTTWSNPLERKQVVVGIGLQVAEQLMSETTLMYIFPRLVSMCGLLVSPDLESDAWYMKFSLLNLSGLYGLHETALPFITAIKRRRRMNLLIKSYRMMVALLVLSFFLMISPNNIGGVSSKLETITHFGNNTCPSYISAPDADRWDCFKCLQAGCGFCAGIDNNLKRAPGGACLTLKPNGESPSCLTVRGIWFIQNPVIRQCAIKLPGPPILILLLVCFVPYTFGLESHMCSRLYKSEVRGRLVGTVAATNWISFLIVVVSFFMINEVGGGLFSALLISLICFSVIRLTNLSYLFVPEMKGPYQSKEDKPKVS